MNRDQLQEWIDRSERPLLLLAAIAVAIYLVDLQGLWLAWGLRSPYLAVALFIDVIFVVDLVVKIAVLRRGYLTSPWFLIDVLCAVPILSTVAAAPSVLQGLRFVRMFRILRALRLLRVLRTLRVLRFLQQHSGGEEEQTYHRVLGVAVVAYAILFVALVSVSRQLSPPGEIVGIDGSPVPDTVEVQVRMDDGSIETHELAGAQIYQQANQTELYLVLGSLIGMLLILVVSRFQIPALFSQQMRALLNIALPQQVATYFLEHPDAYDNDVRMPASVIFCDIKGFTTTVETLPLEELKVHLERALDAVVDAHVAQDMIIDKFIGDAVMSFRGGNLVPGDPASHAYRTVRAALDGIRALRELGDPHFQEVKVGGASATDALIGTFGTSKRLSYTILGDRVNLAARLEGSCNAVGVSNLFCEMTKVLTEDKQDIVWRRIGLLKVQGKDETNMVYQAFDKDDDTTWIDAFQAALALYEARGFQEAADAFTAVDSGRDGGDRPSVLYAGRAAELAREGAPDDWQPILRTSK